ncbi:MAG: aminoglycoside phosphotransferase family protein [Ruminococcus sp.]|nr:aminoglycoside phosphotransferase family protein [Ruminococcus sp.]
MKISTINTGHINRTYLVENRTGKYILQSLNQKVFRSPEKVINNIRKIEQAFRESGERSVTVPHYLTAKEKSLIEANGEVWRVYEYTEQSDFPENCDYLTGYAFGKFINILNNTDLKLETTIEKFHDFDRYYDRFINLDGKTDPDIIKRLDRLKKTLSQIFTPDFPVRNVHNDAKTNNIVFGQKITIIDLDTAMSGFVAVDYGDMIRSGGIKAIESITHDFADGLNGMLTIEEINSLYYGILYVTGELALRYFYDWLSGDRYFVTKTPEQCYKRAEELMSQLDYFEKNSDSIKKIINKAF